MSEIVGFILSGGIGARLAPYSTPELPKQYLRVFGGRSLLDATIDRLSAGGGGIPVHLVALRDHAAHLAGYRARILATSGDLLLEPVRRNTAMAIAVAAAYSLPRHGGRLVLVTPADHQVDSPDDFWKAIEAGVAAASAGRLVLLGIRPTRAETGFGYIQTRGDMPMGGVVDVRGFHEKPDRATAAAYVATGRHFWNSGVFLFRPDVARDWFLAETPALWSAATRAVRRGVPSADGLELDAEAYAGIVANSFDKAVVERRADLSMVRGDFRWRDLGSWRSLVEATVSPW